MSSGSRVHSEYSLCNALIGHPVGTFEGFRRGFAEADVADLAGLHQVGEGADAVLDGHLRVHAVLIVKVQAVGTEALQAAFDGAADIRRAAVDAARLGIGRVADDAELAGQEHLLAFAAQGLAEQFLVAVRAVHVGGIEEVQPEFHGAMQGGDGLLAVAAGGVEVGHAHAAEADGGDGRAVVAELTGFHVSSLAGGRKTPSFFAPHWPG